MFPIQESSRAIDATVSGALSAGSLGAGLWGAISQVPGGMGLGVAGIVGSVAIQLGRLWFDDRARKLADQNDYLRQSQAASAVREQMHLDRIKQLVAQVDSKDARAERLVGVLMAHAPELDAAMMGNVARVVSPDHPS